jgi:TetR/AcrR family transcriptional repressor of nem operon
MRYDKGHKEASRRRILEVASERFRDDGIAATGLAGIMSDAGLTNGAFYPHFKSKADLIRESVAAAMEDQAKLMQDVSATGGLEAALTAYLSAEHRDNPSTGCTLAALLPELAREPAETRSAWADHFVASVGQLAAKLPPQTRDSGATAIGIYATLVGALQMARAAKGTPLSDRILAAGADAARTLAGIKPGDDQ